VRRVAPTADDTVVIARRFCGPPTSGNGGYTSGLAAAPLEAAGAVAVEVTLRVPPPLETPLRRVVTDGRSVLLDGDAIVAEAVAVDEPLDLSIPTPPSFDDARAAEAGYPWFDCHPWPSCYACGTGREAGDGLLLRPGPIELAGGPEGAYATSWVPPLDITDDPDAGVVGREHVWAALDCPTSTPVSPTDSPAPSVLGRLRAQITGRVRAGEPHVVVAWPVALDGRKRTGAAALFTADGTLLGASIGLWIELRPPTDP
jgi:hypothetical protein